MIIGENTNIKRQLLINVRILVFVLIDKFYIFLIVYLCEKSDYKKLFNLGFKGFYLRGL